MTCLAPAWAEMKLKIPDPGISITHQIDLPAPRSRTFLLLKAIAELPSIAFLYVPVREISPIIFALPFSRQSSVLQLDILIL